MTASGSDFLASIAAKAVGAAPLVEPRLPSRFEPRPEGSDEFARAWEEPLDQDAMPGASAPRRRRVAAEAVNDAEPVGRELSETGDRTQPRPPRQSERADPPVAAAEPPAPAQAPPVLVVQFPPAAARVEEIPEVRELPRPLLVVPAQAEVRNEPARVMPRPGFEPAAPAALGQDLISRPVPGPAVSDAATSNRVEAPVPAPQRRALAPDLTLRLPEVRPRPTRGELRAAEPAPPARPPVVNITIGRIEVRAPAAGATPPSRPARPPRPAPQSLAEYLKRRGGGR